VNAASRGQHLVESRRFSLSAQQEEEEEEEIVLINLTYG